MKIKIKNSSIVFSKKINYKYNYGYSDFSAGYAVYPTGEVKADYQKHVVLSVSEGDTIEYCVIQSNAALMAIAAYTSDEYSTDSFVLASSVRATTSETTVDTMETHTYIVPSGIKTVIVSNYMLTDMSTEIKNKISVKVF